MRVIAGLWKGYRLDAPPGLTARPTTDRVKESMFNLMGLTWSGDIVVDLFAGSGALGLEGLSRGAQHAVFVDQNSRCVQTIRSNLRRCHVPEVSTFEPGSEGGPSAEVWRMDWRAALTLIGQRWREIGWVFVDPPYRLALWQPVLEVLGHGPALIRDGVVCEHPRDVHLPDRVGCLSIWKQKSYGDIGVTLYQTTADEP
ncbi:MAG: 16S rRNA (guanine(966)-N(2))-methyltransferase RsmD [Alicyclobacillus sp.]|nr:16S rRNA (guanine(966)-N(2))-methyltransferase RsmD [Alicyclobacillus sp.]